ncbi:MAG: PD-(D/E)XK nuclease family protein, partial [Clostridia bacterium]|nr:PD-(D/E)XK nuclease family protein [Clostridia bacterium]
SLMTEEWGGLAYDREQYLYRGRAAGESVPVEFFLLNAPGGADARRAFEARETARYVKNLIRSGVRIPDKDGAARPLSYGDVAVLLRSRKGRLDLYEDAFRKEGVPVTAEGAVGLYSTPEGEFVLNLLAVIDNPYNDVALLTLLTSPAFAFSPEELVGVRAALKKEPLIRAVREKAEEGDPKCLEFLEKLDRWRRERTEKRLGLFIRGVYDELALSSLMAAGEDGEARVQNVYRIASAAEEYETRGGLAAFLRGAALAVENNREPEGVSPASGKDAVKVMTIHKSKGLQFPVVIVGDAFADVLAERAQGSVNFEKHTGFGFKLHSPEKEIRFTTFTYEAVSAAKRRAETAEELRILYVAMTRAMERLVFFGVCEDADKEIRRVADLDRPEDHVSPFKSYAAWIMAAALDTEAVREAFLRAEEPDLTRASGGLFVFRREETESAEEESAEREKTGRAEEPEERFSYPADLFTPYPFRYAETLPTKTTATEIKNTVKNRELRDDPETTLRIRRYASRRPDFMTEKGLNAAEKGSAAHLALRLIDLGKTDTAEKIEEELDRMEAERFLSRKERKSVDAPSLLRFFSSPLGARLRRAEKVYRELKFTLESDAGENFDEAKGKGETILLQGIVDAAFEEDGRLILIDYKTDGLRAGESPERHLLKNGYDTQLAVYAGALTRMTGLPVAERWIYFTSAGAAVRVKETNEERH